MTPRIYWIGWVALWAVSHVTLGAAIYVAVTMALRRKGL